MNRIITLLLLIGLANGAWATLPEPDLILYGKVLNRYAGAELQLTSGELEWQLQPRDGTVRQSYTTQLAPLAGGLYSYRIAIPQQIVIGPLQALQDQQQNSAALDTTATSRQFDFIQITLDGQTVTILPPSQGWVRLGQGERGQTLELDLLISTPPLDSDGDGVPDPWELRYGFDPNDAADAALDNDGDGLSNRQEFEQASDPARDDRVPGLLDTSLSLPEQGHTLLNPRIIDSDTAPGELWVTLGQLPVGVTLQAFGSLDGAQPSGSLLSNGERFTLGDLRAGKIHLHHTPIPPEAWTVPQPPTSLALSLDDGVHPPQAVSLAFELYLPSRGDATDATLWLDASVDPAPFADYEAQESRPLQQQTPAVREEWYGRSGAHDSDIAHRIDLGGRDPLAVQQLLTSTATGLPLLELPGDSYLDYPSHSGAPFGLTGDLALFMVVNAGGSASQVLLNDPVAQLAITGEDHPTYPKRLRYAANEYQAIYGATPIPAELGIAGLFSAQGVQRLEWNSRYLGGLYPHADLTIPGTGYSIGGRASGSLLSALYRVEEPLEGSLGEVLLFNQAVSSERKWRIYGYLLSKWFGYTLYDASQQTLPQRVMSTSAGEAQLPAEYAADYTYIDDLLFEQGNRFATPFIGYGAFAAANGPDSRYLIIGGWADDTLVGGFEDDILVAGHGNDRLTGLGGADHFVVQDGTLVVDFNPAEGDVLDLSALLQPSSLNPNGNYIHLQPDSRDTLMLFDANGDGSGFTDGAVVLVGHGFRDADLIGLWSNGNIIAGGARPPLSLQLANPQGLTELRESTTSELALTLVGSVFRPGSGVSANATTLEQQGIGAPLPNGLVLPVTFAGTAHFGVDYRLEIDHYDAATDRYLRQAVGSDGLPISLRPGDSQIGLYLIPLQDERAELPETLSITLVPFEEFYTLGTSSTLAFTLSDGPDQVTIATRTATTAEGGGEPGRVVISRTGTIERPLTVRLAMLGTAENGVDYAFLPGELSLGPGVRERELTLSPYPDQQVEQLEIAELVLQSDPAYQLGDQRSARVAILDSAGQDQDGDGMPDNWEFANGLNVGLQDASLDLDSDGLLNHQEYALGTLPNNPDSDGDGTPDNLDRAPLDPLDNTAITQLAMQQLVNLPSQFLLPPGGYLELPLSYRSSDGNHMLEGLGLRLHYPSALLAWHLLDNAYLPGLTQSSPVPLADVEDHDGAASTDNRIELLWDDPVQQWPGLQASAVADLVLGTAIWRLADQAEEGVTVSLGITGSMVARGYRFTESRIDFVVHTPQTADLDGDGQVTEAVDARLLMRHALGYTGSDLLSGVMLGGAQDPQQLSDKLAVLGLDLDIDGNGRVDAMTDGILLSRYLAGLRDTALIRTAVAPDATRRSALAITDYLRRLLP